MFTDPQLLRKCKFCNCHHGHQLTATHYIVCYYIVCFLIQPLLPRFPLPWICRSLGEGGRENAAIGHRTPPNTLTHTHTHTHTLGGDPWPNFCRDPGNPTSPVIIIQESTGMPQSLWALLSASRHEKRECVKLSKHDFLYFCHRHRRIHSFSGSFVYIHNVSLFRLFIY